MENIEKNPKTSEPSDIAQRGSGSLPSTLLGQASGASSSNISSGGVSTGMPAASLSNSGSGMKNGNESAGTTVPVTIPSTQAMPVAPVQMSQQSSEVNRMGTGSSDTLTQQIPPIHDIHIPSMSGGSSTIGTANLLGTHTNASTSGVSQFTGFNGIASNDGNNGQYLQIPLKDVTSGSHPELLKRSSSINSGVGVGIPQQLMNSSQSSKILHPQSAVGDRPELKSSTSGNNLSTISNPVINDLSRTSSGNLPIGNMITPNMLPMNQIVGIPPQQRSHSQPQGSVLTQQLQSQQRAGQAQQQQQQQQLLLGQKQNGSGVNGGNNGSSATGSFPQTNQTHPGVKKRLSGQQMTVQPWHTTDHAPQRTEMNKRIVDLLQQRRPDASSEWYQKLPQMAKRLEEALYGEAKSFAMYNDFSTLKGRLQQLALSMSGKVGSRNSSNAPGQLQQMKNSQQQSQTNSQQIASNAKRIPQTHSTSFQQIQQQQNHLPMYPNGNQNQMASQEASGYQLPYASQNGAAPITIATENSSGVVTNAHLPSTAAGTVPAGAHMNAKVPDSKAKKDTKPKAATKTISAAAAAKAAASSKQAAELKPTAKKGTKRPAAGTDDGPATKVSKTKKPTKKEQEESKRLANIEKGNQAALAAATAAAKNKSSGAKGASQGSGHTEDHRRAVLKQQIQRLLLLRHASKCPHEGSRCPVTTHCASMKTLWQHLMKCKDQDCKVAHCVSSRYVLSHYSKCQDSHCPVCGPVRASIKKASSDNSEIVNSFNNKQDASAVKSKAEPPKPPPGPQPPDSLSSAIYNFTDDQINYHMTHLLDGHRMKSSDIRAHCLPIVDEMMRHANGYIFATPVDPIKLMIPDYLDIIKRPMDLGTIKKRLESSYYRDLGECADDIRLTFDNAMLYNPVTTDVHRCARHFKNQFEKSLKGKMESIEKATEERRNHPDSCRLCGEKDMYFELPNYYCNGKCASRIKRNAVYYSDEKNTLHWCQSCYNDLRDPIKVVGSANIHKKDLKKGKLQAETEELREPMVQCDACDRWVHCICGLFNARRNLSKEMQYFCPSCVLRQRAKVPEKPIVPEKKMLASTLPHCLMSEFIEKRVKKALDDAYAEDARKLNVPLSSVEKAPPLSIRQVSCIDNNQATQEGMRKRYASKNYPVEFPCRAKCILMFQHIDGQDVILFGMYVYEYGHKCPQPNQRRVYISYLDSVHYLRPRQYRTPVYHEILIAYLDYVKARGFHTAHIWACPPMPKDDYIFNIHPAGQKTPKQERLRQWYVSMLDKCVERGIVEEVNDLHTEYMLDESNDATVLPYLDGDYWVGVAEDIIKKLGTEDQILDDGDVNVSGDTKSKRKKSKGNPPKRSRGRQPRGTSTASAVTPSGRDQVMVKLSETIEPMKLDFFVARLHSKEYIARCAHMAEEEQNEESRVSGDKIKDEKKLQEEALASGDGGKMGKMKKAVSLKSGGSSNVKEIPASASVSKSTEVSSSSTSNENSKSTSGGGNVSTLVSPAAANAVNSNAPSGDKPITDTSTKVISTDSQQCIGENAVSNVDSDKMEVDESLPETVSKSNPVINGGSEIASSEGNVVENSQNASSTAMEVQLPEKTDVEPSGDTGGETGKREGILASVSKLASSFFGSNNSSSEDGKMEVEGSDNSSNNPNARGGMQQKSGENDTSQIVIKSEESSRMEIDDEEATAVVKTERQDTTSVSDVSVKVEKTGDTKTNQIKSDPQQPTKDTEDRDDTQECEHFETRLSFLQLCQGNHYQFDQLRRAKHTSMMVLYHLHNPDAPKFMAVCNVPTCTQSIVSGTRYHCDTCDIDFCQTCYVAQRDTKARHIHPLRPMLVSGSSTVQPLTEEQRRERNRSIQLHLQLLLHSARDCIGKKCSSKNCEKMKEFLKHEPACTVGIKKGCPTCKKVLNLLNLHARGCRMDNCRVPKCSEIKEKNRQNQLMQRQMDDRRRQMMNDMYSRS